MKARTSGRRSGKGRGCLLALLILLGLLGAAIARLIRLLLEFGWPGRFPRRHPVDQPSRNPCMPIPPEVYRRPDPLIYSQHYLMAQGLAVTWNNPDIELREAGVPVSSHDLKPGRTYEIVASIWNGSVDAPAVGLLVQFSYLQFGVGTQKHPIGQTTINLPAKGAAGLPVPAVMLWTTPSTPGHYCLQVELVWGDDANPHNNLGQENVDVKPLNSPRARFEFPVHNPTQLPLALELAADFYALPARLPCERRRVGATNVPAAEERSAREREAMVRHGRRLFYVPETWRVAVEPAEVSLRPGETRNVVVDVTAPDGFRGRQNININAFAAGELTGGVTLTVEGGD